MTSIELELKLVALASGQYSIVYSYHTGTGYLVYSTTCRALQYEVSYSEPCTGTIYYITVVDSRGGRGKSLVFVKKKTSKNSH